MARLPKMSHLALVASLLGGVAITPVVLSGPASAQSGSRICGRLWYQDSDPLKGVEAIYKIYEVDKYDFLDETCNKAKDGGASDTNPAHAPTLVRDNRVYDDWQKFELGAFTCETFTTDVKSLGELVFKDDGTAWSNPNQDNLCNTMNKSENIGQMRAYWLIRNDKTDVETMGKLWAVHG